jgi:hypothetical protein
MAWGHVTEYTHSFPALRTQKTWAALRKGHGNSIPQSPQPHKPYMLQEPLVTTVTTLMGTLRSMGQAVQRAPGVWMAAHITKGTDTGSSLGPTPEEQRLRRISCGGRLHTRDAEGHICYHSFLYSTSLWVEWGQISMSFWFAFPLWLRKLVISSGFYWLSVFVFFRTVFTVDLYI